MLISSANTFIEAPEILVSLALLAVKLAQKINHHNVQNDSTYVKLHIYDLFKNLKGNIGH